MNYWKSMYGPRSKEFRDGVKAGVKAYAIWKDGKQLVGTSKQDIKEVYKEIDEGLS